MRTLTLLALLFLLPSCGQSFTSGDSSDDAESFPTLGVDASAEGGAHLDDASSDIPPDAAPAASSDAGGPQTGPPSSATPDAGPPPAPATDAGALPPPTADAEPPVPEPFCDEPIACAPETPICDEDARSCRGCTSDLECSSLSMAAPLCASGRCVSCLTNADCSSAAPVCGNGSCLPCQENSECASRACDLSGGSCIEQDAAIYVSSVTGSTGECGTLQRPCLMLESALEQVSATRRNVVVLPSQGALSGANITVPAFAGEITIIGNGAVFNANITFQSDVSVRGLELRTLVCSGANMRLRDVVVGNSSYGIRATNCGLDIAEVRVQGASFIGINASFSVGVTARPIRVERSLFSANAQAIRFTGSTTKSVIRNNYFIGNDPSRLAIKGIVLLSAGNHEFTYNSLISNTIGCGNAGLVRCGTSNSTLSSNLSASNSFPQEDCELYQCAKVSYSLSEVNVPGEKNISGDPLLASNGSTFSLREGSPAINAGDPALAPDTDFAGNPRPKGGAPDIGATEER